MGAVSDRTTLAETSVKVLTAVKADGICFVGPMLRKSPGLLPSQGEFLAERFEEDGYRILSVSERVNRYMRFADIYYTLLRRGRDYNIQWLQVYGGPSFVVEDMASYVGRRSGQRIIMHLRGGALPTFFAQYPKWSGRVLSRAHAIIVPSAYLARTIGQLGYECSVVPNVVDIARYEFRLRERIAPRLLWMRAFHPIYNPEMAVRTLARLKKEAPDATLTMGGPDKGSLEQTKRLAAELEVSSSITFYGFMDTAAKQLAGTTHDIYINTNAIDNMPVSVVEMSAMGLPIVATAVGGIPDLIENGSNGLLVPPNDDEAMASAIGELLADPSLGKTLSQNGRKLAEGFAWTNVKRSYESVIANVCSHSRNLSRQVDAKSCGICFVGPMLKDVPGRLPSQGEMLADKLAASGYRVITFSDQPNRYRRFVDIVQQLASKASNYKIQWLQVYGGASFIVEDAASRVGKARGQRVIMHLHGGALPSFISKYPNWTRRVLARADVIVTPTEYLARTIRDFGFRPLVIPNALEIEQYPFVERSLIAPKLLWMRAFHPLYNPILAVKALARLKESYPNATLIMGGPDKGGLAETKAWVEKLKLAESVQFIGFMDMEAKLKAGATINIYLNTNRIDNMPVSVLEMGAMGIPVVATSVGGIPDLLTHLSTGLLVADDDDSGMASAVAQLLEDPELTRRLSRNGRRLAEAFNWENVRPQFEAMMNDVLGSNPGGVV